MTNKIHNLINKFLNREVILYIIFGILTTIVDAVVFYISNKVFSIDYIISTIIAWIFAVLFAYITNKIFVFKSYNIYFKEVLKEMVLFFLARVVSLIFTIIWMFVTVEILHIDEFISKLLANIFVVIMNYIFSKIFIFTHGS
ncbi:MAG: GtrA family protein [Clostridium butyricum]|nr:GtrA family protein [Clostridium butyricum]